MVVPPTLPPFAGVTAKATVAATPIATTQIAMANQRSLFLTIFCDAALVSCCFLYFWWLVNFMVPPLKPQFDRLYEPSIISFSPVGNSFDLFTKESRQTKTLSASTK